MIFVYVDGLLILFVFNVLMSDVLLKWVGGWVCFLIFLIKLVFNLLLILYLGKNLFFDLLFVIFKWLLNIWIFLFIV